jgi:hypothetical protein
MRLRAAPAPTPHYQAHSSVITVKVRQYSFSRRSVGNVWIHLLQDGTIGGVTVGKIIKAIEEVANEA